MKIHIDDLPQQGLQLELDGLEDFLPPLPESSHAPTDFEIDPRLRGHLELRAGDQDIILFGKVLSSLFLQCARCLTRFHQDMEVEVNLVLRREEEVEGGWDREHPEEIQDVQFIQDDEIDVGELVLQEILLSIPMKPLCREECPGLCPRCGALKGSSECNCPQQEETDPRWAALAKFKESVRS